MMEDNSNSPDRSTVELGASEPEKTDLEQVNKPFSHFLSGFLLSGLLVFVVVTGSAYANQTAVLEFGYTKLALAALVPLIAGILSVVTKGTVVQAIADAMSNWSGF